MQPRSSSATLPSSRSGRSALELAVEAARRGGQVIRDRFLTQKEIRFKGRADIVTDVDLASEREILGLLRAEYPQLGVLAEESAPVASETGSPYSWVVDPLDGTRNYASGIPHFCVVVALALGEEIALGVTYDPMQEEMFTAQAGQGAFLNGNPIAVSARQELGECLVGFDLGYVDAKAVLALDMMRGLWPGFQSMRLMGSSALGMAYAAAGRLDLYFHHSLSPWDVASGLLLAREAGGEVVDRQGQRALLHTPSVIASSQHLIDRFLTATHGAPWRQG
ncbi:MAG: inositol monophosphatase [Dehalococcoidia bacterium]|nr:inositol monophosphatase [Dehalococcoidia bacterium]MSQ17526.1 inositol monophosphatase [Dehalococcoidia bacterium]